MYMYNSSAFLKLKRCRQFHTPSPPPPSVLNTHAWSPSHYYVVSFPLAGASSCSMNLVIASCSSMLGSHRVPLSAY